MTEVIEKPNLDAKILLEQIPAISNQIGDLIRGLSIIYSCKPVSTNIDGKRAIVLTQLLGADSPFFLFRNSVLFRAEGVRFHLNLLLKTDLHFNTQIQNIQKVNNKTHNWQNLKQDWAEASGMQQTYLFDDILFQSISLFDYIGNIIGFILHGTNAQEANWQGIVKRARDKNCKENKSAFNLTESSIAAKLDKHEREFVAQLANLRAEVAHYKMHFTGGKINVSFKDFKKSSIRIFPNAKTVKHLKLLTKNYNLEECELKDVAIFIIYETFTRVSDVLLSLQHDTDLLNFQKRVNSKIKA